MSVLCWCMQHRVPVHPDGTRCGGGGGGGHHPTWGSGSRQGVGGAVTLPLKQPDSTASPRATQREHTLNRALRYKDVVEEEEEGGMGGMPPDPGSSRSPNAQWKDSYNPKAWVNLDRLSRTSPRYPTHPPPHARPCPPPPPPPPPPEEEEAMMSAASGGYDSQHCGSGNRRLPLDPRAPQVIVPALLHTAFTLIVLFFFSFFFAEIANATSHRSGKKSLREILQMLEMSWIVVKVTVFNTIALPVALQNKSTVITLSEACELGAPFEPVCFF